MREIVMLSGKGGTGKTSLTASFAALSEHSVLADCDVDAADLHLVVGATVQQREPFFSGHQAVIRSSECSGCNLCREFCEFNAIYYDEDTAEYRVDPCACEGCGVCVRFCPQQCIDFPEHECGEWFYSTTRLGPMVHARLGSRGENSGRLVTLVKQQAHRIAEKIGAQTILVDGSPGTGCPVIASVSGASHLVMVAEPTLSGKHDVERVLRLAKHFSLPASLCVNKWDINPVLTVAIEELGRRFGAHILARINYDTRFLQAQSAGKSVVEIGPSPVATQITQIWQQIQKIVCQESSK